MLEEATHQALLYKEMIHEPLIKYLPVFKRYWKVALLVWCLQLDVFSKSLFFAGLVAKSVAYIFETASEI